MDPANGLISVVLTTGQLGEAVERGIRQEFFTEDRDRVIWDFMLGHFRKYGVAPTPDILDASYPSYEIGVYKEPLEYFIDVLAERRREAIAVNFVQEAVERLQVEGPDRGGDVFTQMQQAVLQAHHETTPVKHVSFVDKLKRSLPEWMNGTSRPTIPFGIPSLDNATGGLRQEQYMVLSGLAKAKKTWTMLFIASNMHAFGFPVLFMTFEMSNDEMTERLATLWGKLSYQLVRDKIGLTAAHQASMLRQLHVREMLPTFTGVEDTAGHSTVTSLQALIQDIKPAVVFIDGVYLMTDEVTGSTGAFGTEPLTNISRSLKRLAKSQKIAVIVSTQQLFGKVTKGRTSLAGIGYSSAFSQDADLLVGVESIEERPDIATMRIHGNRSGPQGIEWSITWNLETGMVEEMGGIDEGVESYDDVD